MLAVALSVLIGLWNENENYAIGAYCLLKNKSAKYKMYQVSFFFILRKCYRLYISLESMIILFSNITVEIWKEKCFVYFAG